MPEMLFVEERRRLILERLRLDGRVSVKSLSQQLAVSTVTIRQDLRALEEAGQLERTYGGAVRRADSASGGMPELSFHTRVNKRRREKEAIAQTVIAAGLIHEADSVALDASSTVNALVPHLKQFARLTVVTNSLITAQQFLDSPHVTVLIPGGRLRRDSISIVGQPEGLPEINLSVGFFGARGVTAVNGITDVDADEVTLKRAMLARCLRAAVLVDGSKWGQVAPYPFARLDQIAAIITSAEAPAAEIDALGSGEGVPRVLLAGADGHFPAR